MQLGSLAWKALLTHNPDIFLKKQKNITHPTLTLHSIHIYYKDANCYTFYYVLLTVHLRQWPTWNTLASFYNTFFIILYMFRALYAHHQEVELYWCCIWYRHSQSVAVRCTGWEGTLFPLNLCTGRPLTESDDTRCCISTIQPPDDEHIMLETCRGL